MAQIYADILAESAECAYTYDFIKRYEHPLDDNLLYVILLLEVWRANLISYFYTFVKFQDKQGCFSTHRGISK